MVTKKIRLLKILLIKHLLKKMRNKRFVFFVKVEETKDIDKTHIVLS